MVNTKIIETTDSYNKTKEKNVNTETIKATNLISLEKKKIREIKTKKIRIRIIKETSCISC
jgi:hypothetical protein